MKGIHVEDSTIGDVLEYYKETESELSYLREVIKKALLEATSGNHVDRAIRTQYVLENEIARWSDNG